MEKRMLANKKKIVRERMRLSCMTENKELLQQLYIYTYIYIVRLNLCV